jgi:potassium/hydrogen antiporter
MVGGLKGAVPILLAALAVIAEVERPNYLYGLVYVVVLLSVAVQGTSIPFLAAHLDVPFRDLAHERSEVRRFTISRKAFANGRRLDALPLAERAWIDGIHRNGTHVNVADSTVLSPGDQVDVFLDPADEPALRRIFEGS